MASIQLRRAIEADVLEMASVVSAAFHRDDSPMMRYLFPDHLQRPGHNAQVPWRAARKTARLGDTTGSVVMVAVEAAEDGRERIVGYAWWSLPRPAGTQSDHAAGRSKESAEDSSSQKPDFDGWTYPPEMDHEAFTKTREKLHEGERLVFGEQGANHCLGLEVLAVDPAHRRKGIGRMLVEWGMEKGRREKLDVFLIATPAGMPLYLSCGLKEAATLSIADTPHFCMVARFSDEEPREPSESTSP